MKEILRKLEELKTSHERIRGAQKLGIGSHWWDGRATGVNDAILIIKEEIENSSVHAS
jgi:hypothetical protein